VTIAAREQQNTSFIGSGNNNDMGFANGKSFVSLQNAPSGGTITGMAGGVDGQYLVIWNQTAHALVFSNENGNSLSDNRMILPNGNETIADNHSITFIYSGATHRWLEIAKM
jgi:hypothetical protein